MSRNGLYLKIGMLLLCKLQVTFYIVGTVLNLMLLLILNCFFFEYWTSPLIAIWLVNRTMIAWT